MIRSVQHCTLTVGQGFAEKATWQAKQFCSRFGIDFLVKRWKKHCRVYVDGHVEHCLFLTTVEKDFPLQNRSIVCHLVNETDELKIPKAITTSMDKKLESQT